LNQVGHDYVAPEVLQREDLESWLKDDQVQNDFKALARARIVESSDAPEIHSRLRERYTEITRQPEYLTDEPIEVVVAILLAAFLVDLGPAGARLALVTLESNKQIRADFRSGFEDVSRQLENLGPDRRLVEEILTQRISEELTRIRQRRSWAPDQAREQIRQLVERVQSGDTRHATPSVQGEALYWAARLHAGEPEHLEQAKSLRDQLRQLDDAADTRIVDALILTTEGDGDGALRMLRDVDNPDARSSLFSILHKSRGPQAALEWFDGQERRHQPDLLTGLGWSKVAVALAQANRWEEAAACLAAVCECQEEWPDLLYLEGVINAALLRPSELRRHALDMNLFHPGAHTIEGPEADRRRERATLCFQQAVERMATLFPERADGAKQGLLWLRLTHPITTISQAAREEVREKMQDPQRALSLLPVARAFGITFDTERLMTHLDQRARLGGLEDYELRARFMLAEMNLKPADLIAFLNDEESGLRRVLPAGLIYLTKIEALVKDGQTAKARSLLEEHQEEFGKDDRQRIEAMIEEHEGRDPRPRLEQCYESSHDLFDLHNLVNHLLRVRDWSALRPRLEELFRRDRTLQNALHLVDCMHRDLKSDEANILSFLEANEDLVDRNPDLISARAWALFRAGHLDKARILNSRLRSERDHQMDLQLDINIALQSGEWERFSSIVEREWPKRGELQPETLIRLASLAAEADATANRAVELMRLAVNKGSSDPHLLMAAIDLSYRLGREGEELGEWLSRAIALSSEEGPVRALDMRTLLKEWMPAHRERQRSIQESWLKGKVPLHIAATGLNVPLSYLLIGLPRSNAPVQDGRRRTVIPIVSGVRQPVLARPEWTIGVDVSSVMVLAHLGLLQEVIEGFQQIILAPDTMFLLLKERNRVRFHQPSLVKKAQEILALIGTGQLQLAEPLPSPPQWLSEEVGTDLAQLLQAAHGSQGRVVRPRPIHKLHSFLEEAAQLGEYEHLVLSTVALERLLYRRGDLDETTHERTALYLLSQDHDTSSDVEVSVLEQPLYLDDLAVGYLHSAGLLPALVNCGLDLRIHPTLRQEQSDLIATHREGERLAEAIEEIRLTLRDALQTGKAGFLTRHDPTADEARVLEAAPTLGQFMLGTGPCDALLFDDRYLNRNGAFLDRGGKSVPILCVLDILRHLQTQGGLTPDERHNMLHSLRQAGFALVPVEPDELKRLLTSSVHWQQNGSFDESAELRVIRQTLARVRSLDMLLHPGEMAFLMALRHTSLWVISQLWIDEDLPVERATQLTDWVWRHVAPSPLDWHEDRGNEALLPYLSLLVQPLPIINKERREAFRTWIEERALKSLLPANASVLARLAALVGLQIEGGSDRIAVEGRASSDLIAEYLLSLQPPSIRERLQQLEDFGERLGLKADSVIRFDGASFSGTDLFRAARLVLASGEDEQLLSREGGQQLIISKLEGSIYLHLAPQEGEPRKIPFQELGLLSTERAERVRVLDQCIRNIGPTGSDFSALRQAATERELSDREVAELLDAQRNGVLGLQASLQARLGGHKATIWDLVPDSFDYFERFCGPAPGDLAPEEYLGSVLPEHRKNLLRRDLRGGLEICLLGALRDDLGPGAWLEEVNDDELWDVLGDCQPQLDPFSLLGALDIALRRQHDERFRTFAEDAVAKLIDDQFANPDGVDLYQILPALAQFVEDRVNHMKDGAVRAPFWKRMCAWMQTSLVVRLTTPWDVDFAELRAQLESALQRAGRYAKLLDLRREPMYKAGELSPITLRSEIVGRLRQMQLRHEAEGREVPQAVGIQDAIGRLTETGPPLAWFFPGPLEGFRRPEQFGRALDEETRDKLLQLSDDLLLSNVVNLSQLFHLDERVRSALREMVSKSHSESETLGTKERLARLVQAGVAAAAERDRELAQAIAASVLAMAPGLLEGTDVAVGLHALLIAGAAFEEEGAWAEWLNEQLAGFASRLPAGKSSANLYSQLQELKKVTKLELGICNRAEALASAAAT
jgi:tetratricopeptide (TPR) repeat protein